MKTTSYEISKKLKEIGFVRSGSDRGYDKNGICCLMANFPKEIEYIAFDLETIFSALPRDENYSKIIEANFVRVLNISSLEDYECEQMEYESLADTAARLLILLVEKGIIKFKE